MVLGYKYKMMENTVGYSAMSRSLSYSWDDLSHQVWGTNPFILRAHAPINAGRFRDPTLSCDSDRKLLKTELFASCLEQQRCFMFWRYTYRLAQKSKPLPNNKKSC